MTQPELSVVVAAQGSAEETARCLRTLFKQGDVPLEIIVVAGSGAKAQDGLQREFPGATFLECEGTSVPKLHGAGISRSGAPLIAITEGHCTFPADWAENVLKAHGGNQSAAIGGAVSPGTTLGAFNTGLFVCDYAQFVPPIEAGTNSDLPGNNVIFKRSYLGDTAHFREDGFWKTFFCKQLEEQGIQLSSDPSINVFYNRRLSLSEILERRLNHGRCFGAMRAPKSTSTQRLCYFVAGPVLPILLVLKVAQRCKRNSECTKLALADPAGIVVAIWFWALGEWFGNLAGPGDSCSKL